MSIPPSRSMARKFSAFRFRSPLAVARNLVVTAVVVLSGVASHAATYQFVSYPEFQNGYELSGTVTTNGALGNIAFSDLLTASYSVSKGLETYSLSEATDIYGNTQLFATDGGLYLLPGIGPITPGFALGTPGFGLPQIYYNYRHDDHVTLLHFSGVVDYQVAPNVLWSTDHILGWPASGAEPFLLAIAVPEPSTLLLGSAAAIAIASSRRLRRPQG